MESYLNTDNIRRSKDGVEYHPLRPFLPENAKVLFLGSFPPQRKRWCMDFYYPNFINDHWRIEGQVFFGDRNHFVDLEAKRFRLCLTIVTTGEKATETICAAMHIAVIPKVNTSVPIPDTFNLDGRQILLYRLPSSSRAYPMSFDKKAEAYRQMFEVCNAL